MMDKKNTLNKTLNQIMPAIAAANLHGWLFAAVPGLGAVVGFRGVLHAYMAYAYGVGAPKLYMYMLKQRRKQLGGGGTTTKATEGKKDSPKSD